MALNTFKKSNKAGNENGTEVEGCTSNKITVSRKCIKLKKTEQIEHCLWSSLHNCLRWAPWNLSFVAIFTNIKVMTLPAKSLCGKLLWHHSRLQQQHFMGGGRERGGAKKHVYFHKLISNNTLFTFLSFDLFTFRGSYCFACFSNFSFLSKKKGERDMEKNLKLNRGNCLQMRGFILKLLNSCIPVK